MENGEYDFDGTPEKHVSLAIAHNFIRHQLYFDLKVAVNLSLAKFSCKHRLAKWDWKNVNWIPYEEHWFKLHRCLKHYFINNASFSLIVFGLWWTEFVNHCQHTWLRDWGCYGRQYINHVNDFKSMLDVPMVHNTIHNGTSYVWFALNKLRQICARYNLHRLFMYTCKYFVRHNKCV